MNINTNKYYQVVPLYVYPLEICKQKVLIQAYYTEPLKIYSNDREVGSSKTY